jgi:predicted transcriptional regulator
VIYTIFFVELRFSGSFSISREEVNEFLRSNSSPANAEDPTILEDLKNVAKDDLKVAEQQAKVDKLAEDIKEQQEIIGSKEREIMNFAKKQGLSEEQAKELLKGAINIKLAADKAIYKTFEGAKGIAADVSFDLFLESIINTIVWLPKKYQNNNISAKEIVRALPSPYKIAQDTIVHINNTILTNLGENLKEYSKDRVGEIPAKIMKEFLSKAIASSISNVISNVFEQGGFNGLTSEKIQEIVLRDFLPQMTAVVVGLVVTEFLGPYAGKLSRDMTLQLVREKLNSQNPHNFLGSTTSENLGKLTEVVTCAVTNVFSKDLGSARGKYIGDSISNYLCQNLDFSEQGLAMRTLRSRLEARGFMGGKERASEISNKIRTLQFKKKATNLYEQVFSDVSNSLPTSFRRTSS